MLQPKKKRSRSKPLEKEPTSKAIEKGRQGSQKGYYIIASVVIAIILIILGTNYYQSTAPFRRIIIKVDDTSISMDYFLKRAKVAGVDALSLLDTLVSEQIIKLAAPQYGIDVSEEDVNESLRMLASGGSGNITENELKEWYRQQLNESGLSDSEYKDLIRTSVLAVQLQEYLAERMPTVAEQVHFHVIILETYEDAEKIRARWEAGEKFADLAREASLDEESREKGGDAGWMPRGIMFPMFEETVFNLDIGDVSEPQVSENSALLFMVSEKAVVRELDANSLNALKGNALESWLGQERQFHEVTFHGLRNGFDSETNAWINWQLSKNKPPSEETSGGQ
ncbi:peptidylprolyl isomerase [Chloroflexota bacterium]